MKHPPAFIVTVERNRKRANRTQQLLEQQGIKAELWIGVDGAQPINFNPGESVDTQAFLINNLRPIHPTEIGAYLSHYRLWQHALKHNLERILVFEDDIAPLPQLKHVLPQILALDASHEFINLRPFSLPMPLQKEYREFRQLAQTLDPQHLLIHTARSGLGAIGCLINRSAIQKCIPQMMPIASPVDDIDHLIWTAGLRAFELWPGILLHNDDITNLIAHRSPRWRTWQKAFYRFARPRLWNQYLAARNQKHATAKEHAAKALPQIRAQATPSTANAAKPSPKPAQPPAFVITLEHNIQRGQHAQQLLKQQGLKADLWMGVDGTRPITLNNGESIAPEDFFINHLRPVHPTEIGCYLAHYRLWQHALKHNLERILVFEDDTFPLPPFKRLLAQVTALDTSHEYINLQPHILPMPLRNNQYELTRTLGSSHLLVRTVKFCLGTRGYAISRSGILKALPAMMPIAAPIDEHIDQLIWHADLRAFDIWPGILFHNEDAPNIIPNRNRSNFGLGILAYNYLRKWHRGRARKHALAVMQRKQTTQQYTQHCLQEHSPKNHGGGSGIRTREGA